MRMVAKGDPDGQVVRARGQRPRRADVLDHAIVARIADAREAAREPRRPRATDAKADAIRGLPARGGPVLDDPIASCDLDAFDPDARDILANQEESVADVARAGAAIGRARADDVDGFPFGSDVR